MGSGASAFANAGSAIAVNAKYAASEVQSTTSYSTAIFKDLVPPPPGPRMTKITCIEDVEIKRINALNLEHGSAHRK